ncbi:hypothetical protein B0H63DRAFT_542159 [Podospora didyma]|uniref:Uncharacterized protein n=1 Tax=Podospora didyma TaxID=330526 RepID=A0AAE0U229_9PEZI|nr:hypothetical protein B0H63DRAFT_542159 [Podospora didyma]
MEPRGKPDNSTTLEHGVQSILTFDKQLPFPQSEGCDDLIRAALDATYTIPAPFHVPDSRREAFFNQVFHNWHYSLTPPGIFQPNFLPHEGAVLVGHLRRDLPDTSPEELAGKDPHWNVNVRKDERRAGQPVYLRASLTDATGKGDRKLSFYWTDKLFIRGVDPDDVVLHPGWNRQYAEVVACETHDSFEVARTRAYNAIMAVQYARWRLYLWNLPPNPDGSRYMNAALPPPEELHRRKTMRHPDLINHPNLEQTAFQ